MASGGSYARRHASQHAVKRKGKSTTYRYSKKAKAAVMARVGHLPKLVKLLFDHPEDHKKRSKAQRVRRIAKKVNWKGKGSPAY